MNSEKQLALKMWRKVLAMSKHRKGRLIVLSSWKKTFCLNHNLHWLDDCWLCDLYDKRCAACGLKCTTADEAAYFIVFDYLIAGRRSGYRSSDAVRACNKIIHTIHEAKEV